MKKTILLIAICISSFLGCLDLTIVNTALPAIQQSTGAPLNLLQWVITALFAALSSTMVLSGRLADVYGHRRLIIIGLITFGVASLFAAMAFNIYALIAARLVQGVGIAILYTVPPTIINHLYDKEHVGKAMGYYFSASSLGIASGPLLGGFIVAAFNWQWIFYLNIPFVLISLVICITLLPKKEELKSEKLDLIGALLLAATLLALLLTTTQLGGGGTVKNLEHIAAASIGLVLFICHEKNCDEPILDFSLFHHPTFTLGGIANIALACFYSVAFFLMPLYLHRVRGLDALHIGFMLLPATATLTLVSPHVNKLVEKFSVWTVLTIGFACFTASALMQHGFNAHTPLVMVITSYVFLGLGWALILSPSFTSALTAIPKKQSGIAMGTLGTLHNAGGSIGLALGMLLFEQNATGLTAQSFVTQQQLPFLFIAGVTATVGLSLFFYARRKA